MTTETKNPTPAAQETSEATIAAQTPETPQRPRRRWFLRILGGFVLLILIVVVAAPFVLSMGWVRHRIEASLSEQLNSTVTLKEHSAGYSSLMLGGLDIQNPDGFPQNQSALKVAKVNATFSLWGVVFGGNANLNGKLDGLEVRVFEKADGTTNLQAMFDKGESKEKSEPAKKKKPGDTTEDADVSKHQLDFELTNGLIEIAHEQHGVIETLSDLNIVLKKQAGTSVDLELSARPSGGTLNIKAKYDLAGKQPATGMLETTGLDLARYQPLLSLLGPSGDRPLEKMSGKLQGRIEGSFQPGKMLTLGGKMTVENPELAGVLGADKTPFELKQARFVLEPVLEMPFGKDSSVSPEKVRIDRFRIDLGLLKVQGLAMEQSETMAKGRKAVGIELDADLTAIVAAIGPMLPKDLRKTRGRVSGRISFAPDWGPALNQKLEAGGPDYVLKHLFGQGTALIQHFEFQDYDLSNMEADVTIVAGKVDLKSRPGGTVNGGPAVLTANTNLLEPRKPVDFHLSWQKAQAKGDSVKLLRWVMPFLAGLDTKAPIDFSSLLDADIKFSGPSVQKKDQTALQFLNEWSGAGTISLKEGSFTPAAQWKPLLEFAGQPTKFDFKDVNTTFNFKEGKVQTEMMNFNSKLHSYGVRGNVKLDGTMDYRVDLTQLLKTHKNGKEIQKILGDKPLEATLGGNLDKPSLSLPIKGLLEQALKDNVRGKAEEEINKGLKGLFDKLNKKK